MAHIRRFTAATKFILSFLLAAVRDKPLRLKPMGPWGAITAHLAPTGHFMPAISGGAPDEGGDGDGDGDGEKGDKGDKGGSGDGDEGDGDGDGEEENKVTPDDDWKTKSRKNENRFKREKQAREDAEKKLREREAEDESESEKKIREAKEAGRKEAAEAASKETRSTRLESAVTKVAVKKLKLGDGDKAEEHRFADPDDAMLLIERALAKGDLDEDELFNEKGHVDTEVVERELASYLNKKSHLREGGTGGGKSSGDPDTRKGEAADGDLEKLTPEDHAKRKYGTGK